MLTVIIDYESGNLHSAEKAFQRVAREEAAGEVIVTDRAEDVARADRIVLPGDGAFPACRAALTGRTGLYDAMVEAVEQKGRPFLGICVGMQLMARTGHEYEVVPGLGWIDGEVRRIEPSDPALKVPHMGWNDLVIEIPHPVLDGIGTGDHAYFVHSYQMEMATPGPAPRRGGLRRAGHRDRRRRHPRRHPVPPGKEPGGGAPAHRKFPELAALGPTGPDPRLSDQARAHPARPPRCRDKAAMPFQEQPQAPTPAKGGGRCGRRPALGPDCVGRGLTARKRFGIAYRIGTI